MKSNICGWEQIQTSRVVLTISLAEVLAKSYIYVCVRIYVFIYMHKSIQSSERDS